MSTRGSHSAIRVQSPWAEGMGTPPAPLSQGQQPPGGLPCCLQRSWLPRHAPTWLSSCYFTERSKAGDAGMPAAVATLLPGARLSRGEQRTTTGAPRRSPGAEGTLRRWDSQRARLLPAQFLHTGFGSHSSSLT